MGLLVQEWSSRGSLGDGQAGGTEAGSQMWVGGP